MRTTITLDDHLAVRLERRRAVQGKTFKEVVNEAIQAGLVVLENPSFADPTAAVKATQPLVLGRCLVNDLDNISDALAAAEGEDFA